MHHLIERIAGTVLVTMSMPFLFAAGYPWAAAILSALSLPLGFFYARRQKEPFGLRPVLVAWLSLIAVTSLCLMIPTIIRIISGKPLF